MNTHTQLIYTFPRRRRLLYGTTRFHLLWQGQQPVTNTRLWRQTRAEHSSPGKVRIDSTITQDAVLIIPPIFLTAENRFFPEFTFIFPAKDILKVCFVHLSQRITASVGTAGKPTAWKQKIGCYTLQSWINIPLQSQMPKQQKYEKWRETLEHRCPLTGKDERPMAMAVPHTSKLRGKITPIHTEPQNIQHNNSIFQRLKSVLGSWFRQSAW